MGWVIWRKSVVSILLYHFGCLAGDGVFRREVRIKYARVLAVVGPAIFGAGSFSWDWGPNNCAEIRACGGGGDFCKFGFVSGLWILGSWMEVRIMNKVM